MTGSRFGQNSYQKNQTLKLKGKPMTNLCASVKAVSGRKTAAYTGLMTALHTRISISYMCLIAPDLVCSSNNFFDSSKSKERTSLISLYREVAPALVSNSRISL